MSRRRVQLQALSCVFAMSDLAEAAGLVIISPDDLVKYIAERKKVVAIDTRGLAQFNVSHICDAVNIGSNKLLKRRLQQDKVGVEDLLGERAQIGKEGGVAVAYNENGNAAGDEFLSILMKKLGALFANVFILEGGYTAFLSRAPHLCTQSANFRSSSTPVPAYSVPLQLPVTEILPFLYLGCERDAHSWETLAGHDIEYVMNVTDRCENCFPDRLNYLRVSVRDSGVENIRIHFQKAIDFIEAARVGNGRVLVHCFAGISRSATVAIAYIMKNKKWSLDEAYRFVKTKRPNISPNLNFMGQLLEFERTCAQSSAQPEQSCCNWPIGLPSGNSSSPAPVQRCSYGTSSSMDSDSTSSANSSGSGTATDCHAQVISYAS